MRSLANIRSGRREGACTLRVEALEDRTVPSVLDPVYAAAAQAEGTLYGALDQVQQQLAAVTSQIDLQHAFDTAQCALATADGKLRDLITTVGTLPGTVTDAEKRVVTRALARAEWATGKASHAVSVISGHVTTLAGNALAHAVENAERLVGKLEERADKLEDRLLALVETVKTEAEGAVQFSVDTAAYAVGYVEASLDYYSQFIADQETIVLNGVTELRDAVLKDIGDHITQVHQILHDTQQDLHDTFWSNWHAARDTLRTVTGDVGTLVQQIGGDVCTLKHQVIETLGGTVTFAEAQAAYWEGEAGEALIYVGGQLSYLQGQVDTLTGFTVGFVSGQVQYACGLANTLLGPIEQALHPYLDALP
jgi:hypothetical protein